jgi:hypothetical protein
LENSKDLLQFFLDFFTTFPGLSQDFLRTFSELSQDPLRKVSGLSQKGEQDAAELGANTYANHICTTYF